MHVGAGPEEMAAFTIKVVKHGIAWSGGLYPLKVQVCWYNSCPDLQIGAPLCVSVSCWIVEHQRDHLLRNHTAQATAFELDLIKLFNSNSCEIKTQSFVDCKEGAALYSYLWCFVSWCHGFHSKTMQ